MPGYRRFRDQLAAPAMVLCGLLLVPWILYLAGQLPHTTRARNWSLMWTGLDIAEALGLVLTGILLRRRSSYRALPAAFTSALLAVDAWVDVTTSAPGHAKALAITMAALVEVPAAICCLVLAIRSFPRATDRRTDRAPAPMHVDVEDAPEPSTAGPAPELVPSPEAPARI